MPFYKEKFKIPGLMWWIFQKVGVTSHKLFPKLHFLNLSDQYVKHKDKYLPLKIDEFDFVVEISNFGSLFKVQVWSEKEILMFH